MTNRRRPIRRTTKPRAVKPAPLPAHAPVPELPVDLLAALLKSWARFPPADESAGHE